MIPPPPTCPVKEAAEAVIQSTATLARQMRQLRRQMRRCKTCPHDLDCPILRTFNTELQAAIEIVIQDWEISF